MKALLTFSLVILVALSNPAAAQQIPNGSFETWTNTSYGEVPTGAPGMPWVTNDTFMNRLGAIVSSAAVKKVPDAHSGSYAVCIQESFISIAASNYRDSGGGVLYLGPADFASFKPYGVAYSARPQAISGYYKMSATVPNADTATISAIFMRGGTPIGTALRRFTGVVTDYQLFTIPVSWTESGAPDKLELYMDCGGIDRIVNDTSTRFFLDDVAFDFPNGIRESLLGGEGFESFPNPAGDAIHIRLKPEMLATGNVITLHDASGRLVSSSVAKKELDIPVAGVPAGSYFLQLRSLSGMLIAGQRIMIAH